MKFRQFVLFFGPSLLIGCGSDSIQTPEFNGSRSLDHLNAQVDLGPRVPDSDASGQCRDLFRRHFDSLGLAVDSQTFEFFDPYSNRSIPAVNMVVSEPGRGDTDDRIVILAHYDSRPRAEYARDTLRRQHPIDGANDGASGCAVLMELGAAFAAIKPPGPVDLVFVDAEDWGVTGDHELYAIGSREFARRGIRGKYRFGILVDMVGDSSQQIYREVLSERYAKEINDMVWDAAGKLGINSFIDSAKYQIQDDHLPLNIGGVPTVDIIDFDYPYWHTELDTPDKCSANSLENVGRVLIEIIYNTRLWPDK